MRSPLLLSAALLYLVPFSAAADPAIPDGTWLQTNSNAGPCPTCQITISYVTPHIIQIVGSNGWLGFAAPTGDGSHYAGALEFKQGLGADYQGMVLSSDLVFEGKTLTLNAKASAGSFYVTYVKQ